MSNRVLSDWITAYLKYTEGTEPPESYHIWTAISLISATLQRRCCLRWSLDETIYPNLYVVLIGPSGRCRKGTAMRLGKDIIKDVGIKLVAESITKEALIRRMKSSILNYQDRTDGTIKFHCSLYCMSLELHVFLGREDARFLADLTDWYDCADDWVYETKHQGTDNIQGVCFNLFGATAPDWLISMLPTEAFGGGFTARIIFVVEYNKRKIVVRNQSTEDAQTLREALVDDLAKIGNLSGVFTMSPSAFDLYSNWYIASEQEAKKGIYPIADHRFGGYCDRRATHVRKLCMIFSASRGSSMQIDDSDFNRALSILQATEINMPKAFSGLGKSQTSEATEQVLDMLLLKKKIRKSEVMRLLYRDIDSSTMEIVEKTLSSMRIMRVTLEPKSGDAIYEYTEPN